MSFQQGLSGLNVAAKSLDVIGNNVANAGVVGFKASSAQFGDVFAKSLSGGGSSAVGIGAQLQMVAQQFSQGNISVTNNPLDLAINGRGFFRMDGNGAISYSRNGQFHADKDGFIVNSTGLQLTGYGVDSSGNVVATAPTPMKVSTSDIAPNPTGNFTAGFNLDSRAGSASLIPANFDARNPSTFTKSTSGTIFDTLGNSHVLTLYFLKDAATSAATATAPTVFIPILGDIAPGDITINGVPVTLAITSPNTTALLQGTAVANAIMAQGIPGITATVAPSGAITLNSTAGPLTIALAGTATLANTGLVAGTYSGAGTWTTFATVDGAISGAGKPVGITLDGNAAGSRAMTFNSSGVLVGPTGPTGPVTLSVDLNAVAASLGVLNSATSPLAFQLDMSSATQFGADFSVNTLTQDGYTSGRLSGIGIGGDGVMLGHYSNGQSKTLGQVVMADFTNPNGLKPIGNNQWQDSSESGLPRLGVAGTGSLGVLQASAVEDSNVDLTAELVAMITAQRIYQANAQTIKTQDSVLQTLVNLR